MATEASSSNMADPLENHDTISYEPITDGQTDIAMTVDLEKMKTEADGRQPLQKVWLWTGSKETGNKPKSSSQTTNRPYNVDKDGPIEGGLPDRFSTSEEMTPHEMAVEYLEVGLAVGDQTDRYKAKGRSADKQRKIEQQKRGEASRDPSAMSVFIPVTANISKHTKFYIGVKQTDGRRFPRVIQGELVYFYAEFWRGMPEKAGKKARLTFLNTSARCHATINKTITDRSPAAISHEDHMQNRSGLSPPAATQPEHLPTTLAVQSTPSQHNQGRNDLQGMLNAMRDAAPDFKLRPLSNASVQQLVREIQVAVPGMPDLDVVQIIAVQGVLARNGWGHRLPLHALTLLELCHNYVSMASAGGKADAAHQQTSTEQLAVGANQQGSSNGQVSENFQNSSELIEKVLSA